MKSPAPSPAPWFALLALSALLCPLSARADLIHLKNGQELHGEVLKEGEDEIVVRVPYGELKIRMAEVDFIEHQTPQEYQTQLGQELLRQERFEPAVVALEEACRADTTSAESRENLETGYAAQVEHLLTAGRLAQASLILKKWTHLNPKSEKALEFTRKLEDQQHGYEADLARSRASLERQELEAAIVGFRKLVSGSSEARTNIGAELARCLARRAEQRFRAGARDAARSDLEEALSLDPTQADSVESLYAACALPAVLNLAQDGKVEQAKSRMTQLLAFAPTNRQILYVAGRLEEARQNFPGAQAYYRLALRAPPGARLPESLAALRAGVEEALGGTPDHPLGAPPLALDAADLALYAASTPGKFETLETEHFSILHHQAALAATVAESLEAHRERILAETGLKAPWAEKPKVIIYRNQEEYTTATAQPEWTGGCSTFAHQPGRGLVRIQVQTWQTSPRLLKSVLPHELTHLIVNANLPAYDALPRALHEGFSVYMEPEYRREYFRGVLRAHLRTKDCIPLAELVAMREYPANADLFYSEGFSLTEWLIQRAGLTAFSRWILTLKPGEKFEPQILKLTRCASLSEVEEAWKAQAQRP